MLLLAGMTLAFFAFVQPRHSSQQEFFSQNVITVERGDIVLTLELLGNLQPERQVLLRFPVSGTVAEVLVKEGESVQANQVLARLEDAKQRLELLRAQQGDRQTSVPSSRMPLFPGVSLNFFWEHEMGIRVGTRVFGIDWTVKLRSSAQGPQLHFEANWAWEPAQAQSEIERLERELALHRAQRALDETVLRAPFAGVISEVRVHKGDRVAEEEPAVLLMDLSGWWVEAPVAERDLGQLRPGQQSTVTFEAYPDLALPAELMAVRFSRSAEQTKQLQAHMRLLQDDPRLLPGLTARAIVVLHEVQGVLRIPLEAIVEVDGKSLVTRVREGQLEEVEVQTGVSDDRWIEVRAGLAEGDRILANNYLLYEKYRGRP